MKVALKWIGWGVLALFALTALGSRLFSPVLGLISDCQSQAYRVGFTRQPPFPIT